MRPYPQNSPEAAARIVALVLIADGNICRLEFDTLNRLEASRELGLEADGMPRIVQSLCEDFLMGAHSGGFMIAGVDAGALAALMTEVDEPVLQRKVLRFALAAALANRHLADGEALVLEAACRQWGVGAEQEAGAPLTAVPDSLRGSAQERTAAMSCRTSG